jgi:hypothetical protein
MYQLEYSREEDGYYFYYLYNEKVVGIIILNDPIIKRSHINDFLSILTTANSYGRIEIGTESGYMLTITSGYEKCIFDYRIFGTDFVVSMVTNHKLCIDPLKNFFRDLLEIDRINRMVINI